MQKKTITKILQKHKKAITFLLGFAVFSFVFFSPLSNQALGNLFFGKVPVLYNVTLAQFFFNRSAHPLLFSEAEPWAHYQLGRIAFITGDLPTALSHFEQELHYYPNHTKVWYMKGLTYGYMNREHEGIEAFKKYIENTDDTWASYNDLAWLQFRVGDIQNALLTIEPVAEQQPYNPWIANTYGVLLMNAGRYTEAETSFRKGLEHLSTMTEADWGRAYPGNDPRIYSTGLSAMRKSFESNLTLVLEKTKLKQR